MNELAKQIEALEKNWDGTIASLFLYKHRDAIKAALEAAEKLPTVLSTIRQDSSRTTWTESEITARIISKIEAALAARKTQPAEVQP